MKRKYQINTLLQKKRDLYQIFHSQVKVKKEDKEIPKKKWPDEWKKTYFKAYPRFKEILMPRTSIPNNALLKESLFRRKSSRTFSNVPLSLKQISTLLFFGAGLRDKNEPHIGNRFYPSAGARYPLEIYLLSIKSELKPGLYHYYLKHNSLEVLLESESIHTKKYFTYEWLADASVIVLISAVFNRTTIKYADRGYVYALIETGHLAQNMYLIASTLSLSCTAIGGIFQDELNKLLDIDGVNESVIYAIALG